MWLEYVRMWLDAKRFLFHIVQMEPLHIQPQWSMACELNEYYWNRINIDD